MIQLVKIVHVIKLLILMLKLIIAVNLPGLHSVVCSWNVWQQLSVSYGKELQSFLKNRKQKNDLFYQTKIKWYRITLNIQRFW